MILGDLPAFIVLALACVAFLRWGCVRDDETFPDHHAGSTARSGVCRQCKDVR